MLLTNSYMVVVCWSSSQMRSCLSEMEYAKEMRNVRHSYEFPKRLKGRADYYNFDDCTRFNKGYFYNLERNPLYDTDIIPHDAEYSQNVPKEWDMYNVRVTDLTTNEVIIERTWSSYPLGLMYKAYVRDYGEEEGQYEVAQLKAKFQKGVGLIEGTEEVVESQVVGLGASGAGNVADSRRIKDSEGDIRAAIEEMLVERGLDNEVDINDVDINYYGEDSDEVASAELCNGCYCHVFQDEQDAYNYVKNPENVEFTDFLESAQSDEDWVNYLINGGVDADEAEELVASGNWQRIKEIILDADGAEWFLGEYGGDVFYPEVGYVIYF